VIQASSVRKNRRDIASRPRTSTYRAYVASSSSPRAATRSRTVSASLSMMRARLTTSAATRGGFRPRLAAPMAAASPCSSAAMNSQRACGERARRRGASRVKVSRNAVPSLTVKTSARNDPGPSTIEALIASGGIPMATRSSGSRGVADPSKPSARANRTRSSIEPAAPRSAAEPRSVSTPRQYQSSGGSPASCYCRSVQKLATGKRKRAVSRRASFFNECRDELAYR
jgi:hypothetical protein